MSRTLQTRVAKIEAASPDAAWAGIAPDDMTDAQLEAVIRHSLRAKGIEPPETFTDEYLRTIVERKVLHP